MKKKKLYRAGVILAFILIHFLVCKLVFLENTMTEMTLRMGILHGRGEWGCYGLSSEGGVNTKKFLNL